MDLLDSLNEQQRIAVLHDRGPLLILAGAGSGKTRVITNRIAYLIDQRGVNPYSILAITFTNKAAKEMRERVDRAVGGGSENIWVSTFHSTCVRILRRYIEDIGYGRSFTIYDADDQKSLMKDVCKYLNIDTKKIKERSILSAISSAKDELIGPDEFAKRSDGSFLSQKYCAAYKEYQDRLKKNNALDFDDLIMKTVELFRTCPDVLEYYQRRFRYILVDEYQDTNTAQFELIRLLASCTNEYGETEHNLCVVGDDDQSIYKFRGANIRNILDFEKSYPDARVIKLEQNYRSTSNILAAANQVIHNNLGRKDKALWTENGDGEFVELTKYNSDLDEASGVVGDIWNKVREEGYSYNDFAILYRTNAQSRVFEEKLIMKNIPYRLVGGVNFYQRKEIKDILAYLRTIENGRDDMALKRIINVPKRGIGLSTVDKLEVYANEHGIGMYETIHQAVFISELSRSLSKLESFAAQIESLKSLLYSDGFQLERIVDEILEATGYMRELEETEEEEKVEERKANIGELINKLKTYVDEQDEGATLAGFLEEVSLVGDIDNLDESDDRVILMTLHSAKGLEFPVVYMVGMEDGMFPSYMSINSDNPEIEIEEERRLCYVGITRAKKLLYMSCCQMRMLRGETMFYKPSRFLNEIPRYLLKMSGAPDRNSFGKKQSFSEMYGGGASSAKSFGTSMTSGSSKAYRSPAPYEAVYESKSAAKDIGSGGDELDYAVGDTVKHIKFGNGKVLNIVKGGKDFEVTVEFASGVKKMLASFAKLKKV